MQIRLTESIFNLSRVTKRSLALSADVVLCVATVAAACYFRVGTWVFPQGSQWLSYAGALTLSIPLFISFGPYHAIFRYAGWGALMAVVRACAVYGSIYSAVFMAVGVVGIPRMIGIVQPILLFLAITGSRAVTRYWLGGGFTP